jgi:fermentation-respiration switch protein FrsA (DUF1100 family)
MQVSVDRLRSLQDEPLGIRVLDVDPGAKVTLSLQGSMSAGDMSGSRASYIAGADGVVDLGRDAPLDGSYEGVDPMGLLWSLDPPVPRAMSGDELSPRYFELTARVGNGEASAEIERHVMGPDVVRKPLKDEGFVGTLFRPVEGRPCPGLVVLGGSEGGLVECFAALLASRGYAALALAYFGIDPLPRSLCSIPLEYIAGGISWLRSHEAVAGRRVGVAGASKGGELALLMAATYPELIDAVVAVVPSGVSFMGIGTGLRSFANFFRSSWSFNGAPVPFVPMGMTPSVMWASSLSRGPMRIASIYEAAMANGSAMQRATIPIERFEGPVLLASSEADAVWPSISLAGIATARLDATRRRAPHEHLVAADAGHFVGLPHDPAMVSVPGAYMGRPLLFGGTRQGTAHTSVIWWRRTLDFLAEHLGPPRQ